MNKMLIVYRDGELITVPDNDFPPMEITAEMVKAEASRRIFEFLPLWRQNNLTARAAELAIIGKENWTETETAEWVAGQALWNRVKFIRGRSGMIEAMQPIPEDYREEKYWT